jgi:prepilin-type N-terminal cleavage/methylation domain-containing protein
MNRLISKNKNKIARRDAVSGFTLIEMITVIAIFAVMAGVVLFSGSKFNDTVTLENLTQDVALSNQRSTSESNFWQYLKPVRRGFHTILRSSLHGQFQHFRTLR